jgi:hypothetical protein
MTVQQLRIGFGWDLRAATPSGSRLSGDFASAFAVEPSVPQGLDVLARWFERGDFDLAAVGRALLDDPAWGERSRPGERQS